MDNLHLQCITSRFTNVTISKSYLMVFFVFNKLM